LAHIIKCLEAYFNVDHCTIGGLADRLPHGSEPRTRTTMPRVENVSSSVTWTMQNGVSLTNAKHRAAPSLRFTEAHFVQSTNKRPEIDKNLMPLNLSRMPPVHPPGIKIESSGLLFAVPSLIGSNSI